MENKQKNNLILFLVLLILLLSIYGLYTLVVALINNTLSSDFVRILVPFIGVLFVAFFVNKLQQNIPTKSTNQYTNVAHNTLDDSQSDTHSDSESESLKTSAKHTPFKQAAPLFILGLVLIIFVMNQTGLSLFGTTSIEGRWVYEMEENTYVDGVWNLTDYWYLEFYDDGTLDIGWKNVGFNEDSEGSGTWYQDGSIVYATIYYDYGSVVNSEFVIRSNQLYDEDTGIATGYIKE